jgi:putative inorganic carbon (hco3(-)) transporter
VLFLCVLLYIAALYIRPGELFPSLQNTPIMDYLSAGSFAVAVVTMVMNPRKFWDQPHDKFFIAYFLIVIASNPLNGWIGGGQEAFTVFSPVVFCYFLMRVGVRTVEQVQWCTRTLVGLNVFLAVNALLPVFAPHLAGVEAMQTREGVRIQGTGIFNDPNDLGMTLVMTLPLVLSTIVGPARFTTRLFASASLIVILTACYYTNSRGTMLGLGIVFTIYAYRRFGIALAVALSSAALVGILAFGPSRMSNVSADEASAQGRIQAWAAGYEMLKESPVWGVGWQRFDDRHLLVAHNSFVHALAELGVVGALSFVGIYYSYFVSLRRYVGTTPPPATTPSSPLRAHMPSPSARRSYGLAKHATAEIARRTTPRPQYGFSRVPNLQAAVVTAEQPTTTGALRQRIARDLSDAGVGLLTAMCFLSRQYTVTAFIPVALAASLTSAVTLSEPSGERGRTVQDLLVVPCLTFCAIVFFYTVSRVLVQY